MKRIVQSLPFLFIFGLLIWAVNSLVASMFIPGNFALDSEAFNLTLDNIYTRILIVSFSIMLYMVLFRIFIYEKEQKLLRNAFNHSFPMCIIDFNGTILQANDSYRATLGRDRQGKARQKCHSGSTDENCHTDDCPLQRIRNGEKEVVCEATREVGGARRHFIIKAKPVVNGFGEIAGIIESYDDITERKELELEKQRLINELQDSLEQVKQLKGLLPICPSCKQVRNDHGYWEQIESYLREHSEAEVTSNLCPECKEQSCLTLQDPADQRLRADAGTEDMRWLKVVLQ